MTEEEPEAIYQLIRRYGDSILRLKKLHDLNAPKTVLENEKRMVAQRRDLLGGRIFDAVEWFKEHVKKCEEMNGKYISMIMTELCAELADTRQRHYRAHTLIEFLDDGDPSIEFESGTMIKITWEDIGEGMSGDYNSKDPSDVPLLRFYIYREREQDLLQVDDGSFCTQMPVKTPWHLLEHGLKCIWEDVRDAIEDDEPIKKICEEISWCEPKWFERGGRWEYKEDK